MSNRRGPIERIPGISGAAVLAMSGSVLLAGLVGGEWLRRMPVQIPRTEAMTPVALLLGGLSLLIMRKHRATLGRIFAAAMIGIGIFGYARFVFGDRLAVLSHHLFYGELRSFQRSPSTALCLVLIGSALYSLHNRFSPRMVIAFLLPASCLSFFGLTNCLYGNPAFTKIEQLGWIAPIPALSLVLLCNGIIFEIPEHRVIEALTHPGLIGGIARRLIPTMILIPLTVGGIRLWAQDRGLYGTEFGVAISVTAMVISLVGIVCWSILSLRKFEAAKGKAHTEIQAQQDALDQQNRRIEQGEEELRRNNRRLAEVTRAWDLSNGFIRKVDGTITFWCEGSVQLYGWTKSQAVGKISHELLRTEFPRPLHEIEAELLDKGTWEGELCYYTSENRRKYVASRWVGGTQTHRFGDFTVHPRGSWLPFALQMVCDRLFPMTVAVNTPGLLVGAPISVPVISWFRPHPTALVTMKTWHTLSIPFFCLPAWWFVGNGLDRIREAKPLHLATLLVSSLLLISCIALAVGILMSPPLDKRDLLPFFWGASVWTILFGIVPLAWAFQKHRHRNKPETPLKIE